MSLIKAFGRRRKSWQEVESSDPIIFDITGPITPGSNMRSAYVINMSQDVFVIVFRESNTNNIKAVVATVSGRSVSFGTIYQVGTCSDAQPWLVLPANALCAIDSTRFAVTWKNGSSSCGIVIGTISGTSITFGSVTTISNAEAPGLEWTGNYLIFQAKVSGTPRVYSYTISGSTLAAIYNISLGSSFRIANSPRKIPGYNNLCITTYSDSSNASTWEGRVITLSTGIALGSQAELGTNLRAAGSNIIMFDSVLGFAACREQVITPTPILLRKLSVSGTTITVGNLTTIRNVDVGSMNGGLDVIDATTKIFAITYTTTTSGTSKQKCDIVQYDEVNDVFISLNSFDMNTDGSRYQFESQGGAMALNTDKNSMLLTFLNTANGSQQYISAVLIHL